jgi:PAS domain S-box-containing protein
VIALEAMKVLKQAGLRVPEDVAVVGFDDIAPAALASPPLTTVGQDVCEGARVLVELLLKRMGGEMTGSVTLRPRLVVRESTRPHITQRKRHEDLRLSDERFRLAFENAPIGIALIGISGRWLKVNASMCRMLGYTPEELFATNFQSLTHPDDLANDLAQVEEVLAGKITSYQMSKRYFHRSGRVVPAMLSVSLVRDREQRPQYFVSHVEDVSGRLEAERGKSEFVAVVSHELRAPLTAIHGALGLLASQALGQLPEQANAIVQVANQDCTRLARLINDILDVHKSDAGQLGIRLGPVDLAPFLRQALESNRAYAERCGVTLHLDPVSDELAALADPDRLMQVLSNLLSNASKFSPRGRQVHVRCVPQEARVVIQVIDQGVGIPQTFRPRIFGRFEQADSSHTRRVEGTGLGLNITRNLVHAMGGSINFVSEFGHGTTFFFDLPRVEIDSDSAVSVA